jgi:peptidoglycan/LPS O-acetylase OafA/YrhL
LPALTGLRFVLALWVILFHLTGPRMMLEGWLQSLPAAMQSILRHGYLAVGSFFVLSGFVLAQSYRSTAWTKRNLIRYGTARFARIYPTYLLSLFVVSPFIYKFFFPIDRPRPAFTDETAAIVDYTFVLQGWIAAPIVHWNTPAWSLSCEFFFYLCFPLLLVFLRGARWKLLAAALAAMAIPIVLARLRTPAEWKPLYHMGDFLLGIAAAGAYEMLARSKARLARCGWWLYVPAVLAGAIVLSFADSIAGVVTLNGVFRPVNAALLIGLALGGGIPAAALSTRVAQSLGKASYAMYILHVPVLWLWPYQYGLRRAFSAIVYLAAVVVFSLLVSEFMEDPVNRRIRGWVASRS